MSKVKAYVPKVYLFLPFWILIDGWIWSLRTANTIDLDEVHCSGRMITVDMPLPVWGKTKPACHRPLRPLEVDEDPEKNRAKSL
jgi:hypothetical protein